MDLTYDVLVHIFKYLSKFDRLSASETCRSWYEAANDYYFRKNKVVKFYSEKSSKTEFTPFHIFEDSSFPYSHYYFHNVDITDKFNKFWNKDGDRVRTLTLEYCFIREQEFMNILNKCKNLESLIILFCDGIFKYEEALEDFTGGLTQNSLLKLKSLNLSGTRFLTDALFARLMYAAPALEELDLSALQMELDPDVINEYYLPDTDSFQTPAKSVLTFYFILLVIQFRAKNIKRLKFSNSRMNSTALLTLSEIENLKLESLKIHTCNNMVNIWPLSTYQVSLRQLSMVHCFNLTDQSLIDICNNLVNLELLNIQGCYQVTDLGITELSNLKNLKSLNISRCKWITQDCLISRICAEVNVILEDLEVSCLDLDQNAVITMSERLPNVRKLNLSYCRKGVTDTSLPFIFKNQQLLQSLNISNCEEISDAGLTGVKIVEPEEEREGEEITKLEKGIVYVGENKLGKIYCAKRILNTEFSLPHLKNLKELDISDCYGITDISVAYAFIFKSLKTLAINNCLEITRLGLEYLVRNCPTIEILSFISCNQVSDDDVKETVKNLRRLKVLVLDLQYLRVRGRGNEVTYVRSCRIGNSLD